MVTKKKMAKKEKSRTVRKACKRTPLTEAEFNGLALDCIEVPRAYRALRLQIKKEFPRLVAEACRERSLRQLAVLVGVKQSNMSNYRSGKLSVTPEIFLDVLCVVNQDRLQAVSKPRKRGQGGKSK